jgi:Predicted metal-binding integral membrane protein (DUF2182)
VATAPATLTRLHWHHPEWVAIGAAVVGWLALLGAFATEPALLLGHAKHHGWDDALAHSAVMTLAMMAPLVLTQVHEVAVSSLWRRRYRGAAGYLAGYVAAWTVAGAAMMLAAQTLGTAVGRLAAVAAAAAVALAVAATEDHRRRLRRCHASRPLAIAGWRADRDCVDEGVRMAGRCIATTWALMMAVMVQHGLLVGAAATAVMVVERRMVLTPRGIVGWTAAVGTCAVLLTALGTLTSGAAHLDH